ncbi:PIR protein [Plasmodium vivax]|nr:PIR protein [Plasmodium vivax]
MSNYLGDNKFRLLRTNFFYDQLDNAKNVCQNDAFYNLAKNELDRNGLQDVSDKILKALCYVYEKSLLDSFESDICNFLYYWLSNILLDKMKLKFLFQDVIRNLFNILKNHEGKICTTVPYYMDEHNFKNIKFFFDYSEDYNSYIVQLNTHNPPCNEKYNNYLKSYVEKYNTFQSKCQNEPPSYDYCDVFKKYFDNKNPTHLSTWTCRLEHKEPEKIDEKDQTEATEGHPQTTYGTLEQSVILSGEFKGGTEQDTEYTGPSNYLSRQDTFVNNSVSSTSDGTPSSITSKSVTGAVSVAGALVPSYLLYNYTPAGNLINKLLGRTARMNHNPLMEAQLINNFYQPDQFNSERSRYNLSYRPV